jgi:putative ABC transport system permease protein
MPALLLAAVGLYGVMAFHAAPRTQEFGLRLELGVCSSDVYGLILREGMKIAFLGVVSETLLCVGLALLACHFPSRRATKGGSHADA